MCCCSNPNKDLKDPAAGTAVAPTKPLATDPVCGMTVDSSKAPSVEHDGKKFYFCCQGCATKFQADPAKYLQPKPAAPLIQVLRTDHEKADYTCPMHPEVHKTGPGSCPKCGMALEPATIEAPA
jgi:Cu+-exporting ATPase